MRHPEGDLGGGADTEIENEQRQDGDLRQAVEQKHDRHHALAREGFQADRQADPKTDDDRDGESDGKLEQGQPQGRRHARRLPHRAERGDHARRRADEQRIHETRGNFPGEEQRGDDAETRHARMAEKERPQPRRAPRVLAQAGLRRGLRQAGSSLSGGRADRLGRRHHPRRLPRASRAETAALSRAAMATTKAI